MDFYYKNYLINSIISGIVTCDVEESDETIYVREPSIEIKLKSYFVYKNILVDYGYSGTINESDFQDQLKQRRVWNQDWKEKFDTLPEIINNLKYSYYESFVSFKNRSHIKKNIQRAKKELNKLSNEYNYFFQYTLEGCAASEQNRFLISMSSFYEGGSQVFDDYEEADSRLVDSITSSYYSQIVDDEKIRELSRGEPWGSIWRSGKQSGVFDKPSSQLTSSQRALITWSQTYDNVYESPNKPDSEVIEDDDLLDGWFIEQMKQREKDQKEKEGDNITKGKDYDQVFVMAENPEDAQKIDNLNTPHSKMLQKQDMNRG